MASFFDDYTKANGVSSEFKEKRAAKLAHLTEEDILLKKVEEGLCRKYGIDVPVYRTNRRKDRGESGEELLILGQTVNDRRNPKLWGIRQEDRTRHVYLLGPSGSGKAVPKNMDVLTYNTRLETPEWKKNGELEVGDLIYTRNGVTSRVTDIFEHSGKDIWEMELIDGQVIECSGDHNWIVMRKSHNHYVEDVKTTKEIFDYGVSKTLPGGSTYCPLSIPVCAPMDFPKKTLPVPPYTLGVFLGDGCTCLPGNKVEISAPDLKILDLMENELGDGFFFDKRSKHSWTICELTNGNTYKTAPTIKKALMQLGLCCHAHEKFIPEIYKFASIEQRRELLKGLMDVDGSVHKGCFLFSASSQQLCDDFMELARSLGYICSYHADRHLEKYAHVDECYEVRIFSNDYENIFGLERKKQAYLEYVNQSSLREEASKCVHTDVTCSNMNDFITIVDVRKTDRKADMRCIRVDDPSASYIIDGYVVTHNSTLLHALGVEDMWYWRGGLLMEPHGDLALSLLRTAPPYRLHDIIYLNVLDPVASPGFNPLELPLDATDDQRQEAVGAVTSLIQKHFNMEAGYVKLVKMLTTALNVLSYVPGATLLEIMDFYNNEDMRNTMLQFVPEGPIRDTYADIGMNAKADDLGSLDSRMSRFSTNRYMKHLFGQSHTTVDFFELMNKGYYIICPVSKGGTQDDIFLKFYGSYIVSQVYKAATMRESIAEGDRVNFAMTLDEFQNFMSDDIEGILAEARKYGLQLMLANQYLMQLTPTIEAAVLQNCATKLSYNLGPADAPKIAKTYGNGITAADMQSIPKYHVMAAPLIRGGNVRPFISAVFPPITMNNELAGQVEAVIAERTRDKFMKNRDDIDAEIAERKQRLASGNKEAIIELMKKKNR